MPRLQLLVLMLVLVVILFPEKSVADDEPPVDAAEGATATAPADANSGSSSNAKIHVPGRAIECYEQELCTSKDCLKPDKAKTITCPDGYCRVKIEEKDSKTSVTRGCAPVAEGDCYVLQFGRRGGCLINDKTIADRQTFLDQDTKIFNCLNKGTNGLLTEDNSNAMFCSKKAGEDAVDKVVTCICNKALCNYQTSPEEKHLGYNLAFLGVLLVVLFHLQTMFYVE